MVSTTPDSIFTREAAHDAPALRHAASRSDSCRRGRSLQTTPTPYCWVQRRPLLGQYDTLMRELMREAHGDFKRFLRMSPEMFLELVQRISPRITKKGPRRPLEPGIQLAITLRFLATGCGFKALEFDFRVGQSTITLFVPEVCYLFI